MARRSENVSAECACTHVQMDGEAENIMPLVPSSRWVEVQELSEFVSNKAVHTHTHTRAHTHV